MFIGLFLALMLLVFLPMLLWLAFTLTGGILMAACWLFIKLPLALICFTLALVFCLSLILIPLGIVCFKIGLRLLIPGV